MEVVLTIDKENLVLERVRNFDFLHILTTFCHKYLSKHARLLLRLKTMYKAKIWAKWVKQLET